MGLRFLVVDDSELNIKVTETILARAGVELESATNALDAYELIAERHYDMILMDYLMPGIDGLSATKHIRKMQGGRHTEDYYKNIPILGLTGEDSSDKLHELLDAGVNDILFKPIHLDDLQEAIRKWCNTGAEEPGQTGTRLPDIYGIEPQTLKDMCELDADSFRDMLTVFAEDIPGKHERVSNALAIQDYELYTVEVHRIKGEARMIGAYEIAEQAKDLEFIGKAITGVQPNGQSLHINIATIKQDTPELLEKLSRMNADIQRVSKAHAEAVEMATANNLNSGIFFSEKEINKLRRYAVHAKDSLNERDYKLTNEWLEEIIKLLGSEE